MPEWMLTGRLDAKFANAFASESPFVRMIQGQQHDHALQFSRIVEGAVSNMIAVDEAARERIRTAAAAGAAGRTTVNAEDRPTEVWDLVELQIEPPSIEVRDKLRDAQAHKILQQSRVMSRRTWAARADLDWEQELANIADEETALGPTMDDELADDAETDDGADQGEGAEQEASTQ